MSDEMVDIDKKVSFATALGKVLGVVEDEGYYQGWDTAFDLGRSSGSSCAAYEFVEWLVTAYDKTLARLEIGTEMETFDDNFHLFLENFEPLLPFKIDWVEKKPIFPDDDEEVIGD